GEVTVLPVVALVLVAGVAGAGVRGRGWGGGWPRHRRHRRAERVHDLDVGVGGLVAAPERHVVEHSRHDGVAADRTERGRMDLNRDPVPSLTTSKRSPLSSLSALIVMMQSMALLPAEHRAARSEGEIHVEVAVDPRRRPVHGLT